jgi:hypothetical protein
MTLMRATPRTAPHVPADNKVKNLTGQDLGRVEEVLVDRITGAPTCAVIAFGGFLGTSDRLFAVPWSALLPDSATHTYYLRADRHTLRTAPKFSRRQRPHLTAEDLEQAAGHFISQPTDSALAAC